MSHFQAMVTKCAHSLLILCEKKEPQILWLLMKIYELQTKGKKYSSDDHQRNGKPF
jgi:hypothetical protein